MIGIFQLHYDLLGPLSYMWSSVDRNVIMQRMTALMKGSFVLLPHWLLHLSIQLVPSQPFGL